MEKKKTKPKSFNEESTTLSIRVPFSKKQYYKKMFESILISERVKK